MGPPCGSDHRAHGGGQVYHTAEEMEAGAEVARPSWSLSAFWLSSRLALWSRL